MVSLAADVPALAIVASSLEGLTVAALSLVALAEIAAAAAASAAEAAAVDLRRGGSLFPLQQVGKVTFRRIH